MGETVADSANVEIELKFDLEPQHARRLGAAPWLKAIQQGPTRTRKLHACYFDTPDLELKGRGISLRVRKEGRGYVQCVKVRGSDLETSVTRREWEVAVPTRAVDPEAIRNDPELNALIPAATVDRLQLVFETDMRRTSRRLVTEDGSEVAADLDSGEIRTRERVRPVYELELELKSGRLESLFDLARRVADTAPVRLNTSSKAARGFELLNGARVWWQKADKVTLDPAATGEDALAATVSRAVEHIMANEACVLARMHVEGVHQMRVACRRLRSALNVYKDLLPAPDYARINDMMRQVISGLGPARDWDVFVDETLKPVTDYLADDEAMQVLRAEAEKQRDAAYVQAAAMIRSKAYGATLIELVAWLHARGWRRQDLTEDSALLFSPATRFAEIMLAKRYRKLTKAGKHIKKMTTEERHQFRITIKKMRYAAELFASLYPAKRTKDFLAGLSALQDSLGLLNDIAVSRGLLRGLAAAAPPDRRQEAAFAAGLVVGWHTKVLAVHENDLFDLWDTFAGHEPFWT
ncbi:MAG: CYTH and CHAD domain-containing protein [Hyphomicrobiales bacterium]|nr:CYTH and CHAD domain-containing protein [Hyphomicrobiales bacterium]MCP5370887.1 CYTH and CHAD domain-containing protein [Hyphomicrobiales bacterium]